MNKKIAASAVAAIMLATLAARGAIAAADYSLRMESKEIIFDIANQTATSMMKTVIDGDGYRVIADRAAFDFKNNMLRAEGNVSLYYTYRTGWGMFFLDDMAGANADEHIAGRELILSAENAEAMIFSKSAGRTPLTLDLELGRFTPALRGMGEAPAIALPPSEEIVLCYELLHNSAGKFMLYDATYISAGGGQYYTSALVADGPDLARRTAALRSFEIKDENGVLSSSFNGVIWFRDTPRSATFADIEFIQSKDEGFSLISPTITHSRSFGSFGIVGSAGADERWRHGNASLFTYTGSRNEFIVSYSRATHDYSSELYEEHYDGSQRVISAEGTLWKKSGRMKAYYADSTEGRLTSRNPDIGDSDVDSRSRYGHALLTLDPVALPIGVSKFGAGVIASRVKYRNFWKVPVPDTTRLGADRLDRLTIQPYAFTGAIPIGSATLLHNVSHTTTYSDYRNSTTTFVSGIPILSSKQSSHQSHYELAARARLLLPLGERAFFDASSDFRMQSGKETSEGVVGITIAPGMRDYAFVGAAFNFNSNEWDIFHFDYRIRLNGGARLGYSMRYDLDMDEIISETMGLQMKLGDGSATLSYDESNSNYYLRYFTRNWSSRDRDSIFD